MKKANQLKSALRKSNIKYHASNRHSEDSVLVLMASPLSFFMKKVFYIRSISFVLEKGEGDFSKMGEFRINRPDVGRISCISSSTDDMYLVISVMFNHKLEYAVPKTKKEDRLEKTPEVPFGGINSMDGRIELFIFNVAVVDAVKTMLKDPFEAIQPSGTHWGNL